MRMNRKSALVAGAGMAVAFLGACSDSPTAPAARAAFVPKSSFAVNTVTPTPAPVAVRGVAIVCKTGNAGGDFTFTRNLVGGSVGTLATSPSTIAAGTCLEVVNDQGGNEVGTFATITESDAPNTVETVAACSFIGTDETTGLPTTPESCLGTFSNGGTIFVNSFHGYVITYNNVFTPPPPPPGNQGCTPGYWKQSQHFGNWTTYARGDDFDATFGVNFFSPNLTLLQAVSNGGGGVDALARHGVAALLNAASGGVDYAYSEAQVIDIVQGDGDFAGMSVEARKDLLAAANEGVGGCPLARAE